MTRQQDAQEEWSARATRERWALTKGALNVTDAACYMSVRERLLMDMANKGEIPYVKIGRDYLFIPDQLDEWLKQHSTPSANSADIWAMTPSQPALPQSIPQEPIRPKRGPTPGRLLGD